MTLITRKNTVLSKPLEKAIQEYGVELLKILPS